VSCDINIQLMVSAPIKVRLDSVLLDSKHSYELEVNGLVGDKVLKVLPSALTWQTVNTEVATVSDEGILTGVSSGSTQLVAQLVDYTDTVLVNVEVPESEVLAWETFNSEGWKLSSTAGFNPELNPMAGGEASAGVTFNYAIGRSPFVKLEKTERMYSLPDTIRWAFMTDAQISKVNFAVRPNNASLPNVLPLFNDGAVQNAWNSVAIPVRETFGDDIAIFPLWLEYINFLVDTKTTNGAHTINLKPIELVYSEYAGESALQNTAADSRSRKILEEGQMLIERDGVRYTVLGTEVRK